MCFFFNDTATPEIYTLSLHDALPISCRRRDRIVGALGHRHAKFVELAREQQRERDLIQRSEEHTSELQSQSNLVCRLLLEKKNTFQYSPHSRLEPTTLPPDVYSRTHR